MSEEERSDVIPSDGTDKNQKASSQHISSENSTLAHSKHIAEMPVDAAEDSQIAFTIEQTKSPIPPPQMLAEYAKIIPDFPNRIFEMVEAEQRASITERENRDAIIRDTVTNRETDHKWFRPLPYILISFILVLVVIGFFSNSYLAYIPSIILSVFVGLAVLITAIKTPPPQKRAKE